MISSPKLSIITICLNEANIEATCKSIVEQTWQNFEWIVIDGGSTQEFLEILDKFRNRMTIFISEKDEGIYHAMNKGIEQARGEYLLFMNGGDSLYDSQALEDLFSKNDWTEDIVCCDAIYKDFHGNQSLKSLQGRFPLHPSFLINDCLPHQSTIIHRSLFVEYGGYNKNYRIVSDWEKWIQFILIHKASCVHFSRILAIHYRTGISSNYNSEHLWERQDIIQRYRPYLQG